MRAEVSQVGQQRLAADLIGARQRGVRLGLGGAGQDLGAQVVVAVKKRAVDAEARQGSVELCSTDRVWFFRTADRAMAAVPLEQVPPLVFSEAMRDVDLFVGVSSIALDPNWADPYYDYWLHASFGPLSATAEVRRDVLARLLPKTTIAERVELGDRYLRVQGNRGIYKVHLGSANILIEPDDRYLCIVPASSGRTKRVMLPFEGDEVLSVILSKALLLAADDKITDPQILRQLKRRA